MRQGPPRKVNTHLRQEHTAPPKVAGDSAGVCLDALCWGEAGEKPLDHYHVSITTVITTKVTQRAC